MDRWISLALSQAARYWSYVDTTGSCWTWTGGKDKDGYGKFAITAPPGERPKQRHVRAHRIGWEMAHCNTVPADRVVMHSCDNPACVNPAHLSIGTQADNRMDCGWKGRNPRGTNHHSATIDDGDVRRIRELRDAGVRPSQIAATLGLNASATYGVYQGRTWKHVA